MCIRDSIYSGQEAIAVGAIGALKENDYIVTHYRDHGHALARGLDTKSVMAELFGKVTGCTKGRGGSMHLFDVSKNFMGGYAIVGGQMPIAAGLALSCQLKHEDKLVICYLGDGALNEGEFHEAMNLAAVRDLPIIYFCENNLYGMGIPVAETFAMAGQIYKVAEAYNMPGWQVDGMDILAVLESTKAATEHVKSGNGPVFIEAQTYRFRGHSIAEPASYRKRTEVRDWLAKDPIDSYRNLLIERSQAKEDELNKIDHDVYLEIEQAVIFAKESEFPDISSLYEDVYSD